MTSTEERGKRSKSKKSRERSRSNNQGGGGKERKDLKISEKEVKAVTSRGSEEGREKYVKEKGKARKRPEKQRKVSKY